MAASALADTPQSTRGSCEPAGPHCVQQTAGPQDSWPPAAVRGRQPAHEKDGWHAAVRTRKMPRVGTPSTSASACGEEVPSEVEAASDTNVACRVITSHSIDRE
jgi:hypothetical protein